jgi:uncharacterized protein YqgC (DUF456 family)
MVLDVLLIAVGALFMLAGLLGCFLPVIPGPPLCYVGLLFAYFTGRTDFTGTFLLVTAALTVLITALDYLLPAWGVKKWGGTRAGAIGSMVGLVVGLFFSPIGILLGTFLGAVVGELMMGRADNEAVRSGVGSLIGFILGTGVKLTLCFGFAYYFVAGFF